ncbi:MAG: hypothetical protein IAF58_17295 [Leptolyngbya sp.]|nr:hypothetical protein [Candidatus Melainabacteria bacterium]
MTSRSEIIGAIDDLGNRVTVADVVAKTGLPFAEVSSALNQIAADAKANLEVADDGEIYYCFSDYLKYVYYASGISRAISASTQKVLDIAFFVFRLSFGITLLFSLICFFGIALIVQTLLAGVASSTESVAGMWRDFFGLVKRLAFSDLVHLGKQYQKHGTTSGGRQGFLLNCYSFLFGEGDPNREYEENKWKLLAQVIRLNEGVVVPEHLAPYTGQDPDDEQILFPVLAKFNGMPEVSSSGNIIYVFPEMQKRSEVTSYALLPSYIEFKHWTFSRLKKDELKPVAGLAALNFMMSITACMLLVRPNHMNSTSSLFVFFCFYGLFFLVIPLLRLILIAEKNKKIRERNHKVKQYEQLLSNPPEELAERLEEAEHVRKSLTTSTIAPIVYSTKSNYLEQISDTDFQRDLKTGGM